MHAPTITTPQTQHIDIHETDDEEEEHLQTIVSIQEHNNLICN